MIINLLVRFLNDVQISFYFFFREFFESLLFTVNHSNFNVSLFEVLGKSILQRINAQFDYLFITHGIKAFVFFVKLF